MEFEVESRIGTTVFTESTETAKRLSTEIRSVFRSSSSVRGTFLKDDATTGQYSQLISRFHGAGGSQAAFEDLARDAVEALVERMRLSHMATGGLVIFAYYEHDGNHYLLSALVTETQVPWFDSNMNLMEHQAIDLKKLRHGVRVDMGALGGEENGVSLLTSRNRESAHYFEEFVDFVKKEDPAQIANALFKRVEKYCAENKIPTEEASAIQDRIYSYWSNCKKQGILMTLAGTASSALPDAHEDLLDYLSDENEGVPGEFQPPSSTAMRKFTRFSETEDGLTLTFTRGRWGTRITVDDSEGKRRIVIDDAPEQMVEKLKNPGRSED